MQTYRIPRGSYLSCLPAFKEDIDIPMSPAILGMLLRSADANLSTQTEMIRQL